MYENGFCNVWFDYQEGERKGRGGKVTSILLYIYTKENPKHGEARPWKKGDEPLCPFELHHEHKDNSIIQMRVKQNPWYNTTSEAQEYALQTFTRSLPTTERGIFLHEQNPFGSS